MTQKRDLKPQVYKFLFGFSFIIYFCLMFMPAVGDLTVFDFPWMKYIESVGFFHMYDHFYINYPPIYSSYLGLLSYVLDPMIDVFNITGHELVTNYVFWFYMHSFGFLCHIVIMYYLAKQFNVRLAVFWAYNPVWIFNFIYGQRDEAYCFLIMLMIYFLWKQKFHKAFIILGLISLFKSQFVLLIIPLLCYCIRYIYEKKYTVRQLLFDIVMSFSIGYIGWLPFTVINKNLFFPFIKYYSFFVDSKGYLPENCFFYLFDISNLALFIIFAILTIVFFAGMFWFKLDDKVCFGFTWMLYVYFQYLFLWSHTIRYGICFLVFLWFFKYIQRLKLPKFWKYSYYFYPGIYVTTNALALFIGYYLLELTESIANCVDFTTYFDRFDLPNAQISAFLYELYMYFGVFLFLSCLAFICFSILYFYLRSHGRHEFMKNFVFAEEKN